MSRRFSGDTAAGAVVAAAFASMCCILPPVLGAIGLSGAVLSAFFEPLRPFLLALAVALLAAGFYSALRKPGAGQACGTESRLSRASRPTLWVAVIATAALATFPSFYGLASGGVASLPGEVASSVLVLEIEGMTCEACTPSVRHQLLEVPGVIDAAVSHERGVAEVRVRDERPPEPGRLLEAVSSAGYTARLME